MNSVSTDTTPLASDSASERSEAPGAVGLPLRSRDAVMWLARYRRTVALLDAVAIVTAIVLTALLRFGAPPDGTVAGSPLPYPAAGALIGLTWWLSLNAIESRSREILGAGPEEYRRVLKASFYTFGFVAVASYLAGAQLSRLFFVGLLPVGVLLLLTVRWACRLRLNGERAKGRALVSTLVVGALEDVDGAVRDMLRHPQAGFLPAGVAVTDATPQEVAERLPELMQLSTESLPETLHRHRLQAVAVAGGLSRTATRQLAWQLENSKVQLMVVPRMTDVAGPRLRYSAVEGLKLVHVDLPRFSGLNFWMKRTFDIVFSAVALLITLPLLAVIAVAIKLDDGGPVIFRQERVGRGGKPFIIHKFRTMCIDAEAKIAPLIQQAGGQALLFKIEDDPRITRVGQILRKYSLDELPQFWTVLRGGMSIVGPRPQVEREVAEYTPAAHRRLLIKPGITGLWQVSGRSELSIEESIRIDLRYVENWSLTGDIAIILRTIKVVLFPSGAY